MLTDVVINMLELEADITKHNKEDDEADGITLEIKDLKMSFTIRKESNNERLRRIN